MKQRSTHPYRTIVAAIGALSIAAASIAAPVPDNNRAQMQTRNFYPPTGLVSVVRDATRPYLNVENAGPAGYDLASGCISGDHAGTAGVHYVNFGLVGAHADNHMVDPAKPEVLIYEPLPFGRMRLVAAEYFIFADDWNSTHPGVGPDVMGQNMQLIPAENRFQLPATYILRVWAWKDNPNGMFSNWNPRTSCEYYQPPS